MRTPVANIGNNNGAFQLYGNNKHAVRREPVCVGGKGGGRRACTSTSLFTRYGNGCL